jgi:ATP-dependent protease ClpP protease subunit
MEWWNWPDDVIPHRFRQELAALGDVSTIHVRINSNGGSVFGAYAIMNLLKSHTAQIITYNDGIAASAATLIAMAGDKVVSAIGSMWMIHRPSTGLLSGNVDDFAKAIEVLDTITESMVDVYHAKTGIDKEEITQMLNSETWMTGTQAKEKGFADEVAGVQVEAYLNDDKATASFNGLIIDLKDVRNKEAFVAMLPTKVQNKPDGAAPAAPVNMSQPEPATGEPTPQNYEEVLMTLEELKAKHPDIHKAAFDEGVAQGVTNGAEDERARIQAIDNLALPGMDDLTNRAKYETGITAAEFAMEIVSAQKEKGAKFLNDAKADAEDAGAVPPAGAPQDDEAEEKVLLAHSAEHAKNFR